jgi:hypothetical protein
MKMWKYILVVSLLLTLMGGQREVMAAHLHLSWNDNSASETGFQIERRTLSEAYSQIATVEANVTTYSDSTATPGTTYCYRVLAFNTEETSIYSDEICGSPVSDSLASGAMNAEGTVTPSTPTANGTENTTAQQFGTGIGVFRATTDTWHLDRNENGLWDTCLTDGCVESFGLTGDLPVVGDWDGSGKSAPGLFRPSTGQWLLDFNGNGQWDGCTVDKCLDSFGDIEDLPVVGDWDGSGKSAPGLFRPSTGQWFLDFNGNGQWDGCTVDKCLDPFGDVGDLAVAGDWDGSGKSAPGLFRPSTGQWFLDLNGNGQWDGCTVDKCLGPFGIAGDLPVAGDWNNVGIANLGIFDSSIGLWELDMNGNGLWDGCQVDRCIESFGQEGDLPVVGKW